MDAYGRPVGADIAKNGPATQRSKMPAFVGFYWVLSAWRC